MPTKKATFIKELNGFNGEAHLYSFDPPLTWSDTKGKEHKTKYAVVSAITSPFDTGRPETFIFPATRGGKVKDYLELEGSLYGDYDHKGAVEKAGYTIVK